MQKNLLSASISDADFAVAMQHLDDFEQGFAFLLPLPKQDAHAHRMGSKSVGYVNAYVNAATTFPNHVPPSINLVELVKDKQLFDKLSIAVVKLSAILNTLQNGKAALAQDLMQPCNVVYSIMKLAAKRDAAIQSVVQELSKRYQHRYKSSTNE